MSIGNRWQESADESSVDGEKTESDVQDEDAQDRMVHASTRGAHHIFAQFLNVTKFTATLKKMLKQELMESRSKAPEKIGCLLRRITVNMKL